MAMSLQEIFTRCAVHLLRQNTKSMQMDWGRCAYRGQNGKMCAVGVLIPDAVYDPILEGHSVNTGNVLKALFRAGVLPPQCKDERGMLRNTAPAIEQIDLLSKLQMIHDTFTTPEWEAALTKLANERGLSMPDLNAMLARCTASTDADEEVLTNEKEHAL